MGDHMDLDRLARTLHRIAWAIALVWLGITATGVALVWMQITGAGA